MSMTSPSPVTGGMVDGSVLVRMATKPPVIGLITVLFLLVIGACVYCCIRVFLAARLWRATPLGRATVAYQVLRTLGPQAGSHAPPTVGIATQEPYRTIYMPD
ncbi:ORF28 [Human gammaherpesvirus 8]|uniref:Protein ORF28 n=3 Tax=Human herpesvirus 8 TaxID=37296 RepID=ORF28_HHV8P|nr:ORF28 [Human gammaherpesvirus 8]F5HI25.1 RecName: Full=Protein ORF28 [Human herpesvirus 8 strain GK18]AAC57109.1 ORF 28 [Human herpesvirus 8 type M]ANI86072.1 ORF28 [synthetic construct]AAB62624.1 ORF 28 [Human gammaherpesvirus 8]ABD28879.1 ORF28 [Human gammaherpesvirus 8]ACY00426.1 ORF28 [Human gammaherpesvirus 8]